MTTSRRTATDHLINHFAIDIDESDSMWKHRDALIKAMDSYVAFLGECSREQDQETRLSVYTFSSHGQERCLFYDMDVLRVPSIKDLYRPHGLTALVDCAMLSIRELEQTATLHGNHAFWLSSLSDGLENDSRDYGKHHLAARIGALPENWTTAAFGPHAQAVVSLRSCGFPADNVSLWDATSATGVEKVGSMMRDAAAGFMEGRARGINGYNKGAGAARGGLFRIREFSAAEVTNALAALDSSGYDLLDVPEETPIRPFVERAKGRPYRAGEAYYQFMKKETIQPSKKIAVLLEGRIYTGQAARGILGLPDHKVDVAPDHKQGCTIFIESRSVNRKLVAGTWLLLVH